MMATAAAQHIQAETRRAMAARVKMSKTSFAAGMAALPPPRRAAMHALYAFCREVDDIADDGIDEAERHEGLALWRQNIADLFAQGDADDPICAALLPAVLSYNLVAEDFQAIIDGMAMDAGAPIVAPDLAAFDLYCDRVASAVGRVSVRIFGDGGAQAMKVAHHLGRALQITNILRDLHEDAARGRLYLPREILLKHGVPPSPAGALAHPNLPRACQAVAILADKHFADAWQAMERCDRRAMIPARMMGGYYAAILKELKHGGWRDPAKRVRLSAAQKAWIMLRYRFFA